MHNEQKMLLIVKNVSFSLLCLFLFFACSYIPANVTTASTRNSLATKENVILRLEPELLNFYAKSVALNSSNGSVGFNRDGYMSVGAQRYSSNLIAYGLVTKNVQLIETGIGTIEYAFAHQNRDGSFPDYSARNFGRSTPSSVAFFFQDMGQSLLLCKDSEWFQQSKKTANLRVRLKNLLAPTATSLTWLMGQEKTLLKGDGNGRATNRLFIDALAFYLVGKSLNRSDAVMVGERFASSALQQQTKDGCFMEMGGYDSSYQGVSLFKALVLYTNLEPTATSLRQDLWTAIQKGITLQLRHISTTGKVLTEGNTRVYSGGEKYFDREKHVDYWAVILGLNYYSKLSDDGSVQTIADRVFAFYQESRKHPKLS